jgi:hypothetical protein
LLRRRSVKTPLSRSDYLLVIFAAGASSSDTGLPDDALLVSVLELWRGALLARFTLDRYWLDWNQLSLDFRFGAV